MKHCNQYVSYEISGGATFSRCPVCDLYKSAEIPGPEEIRRVIWEESGHDKALVEVAKKKYGIDPNGWKGVWSGYGWNKVLLALMKLKTPDVETPGETVYADEYRLPDL